jgi:hypothetical protein
MQSKGTPIKGGGGGKGDKSFTLFDTIVSGGSGLGPSLGAASGSGSGTGTGIGDGGAFGGGTWTGPEGLGGGTQGKGGKGADDEDKEDSESGGTVNSNRFEMINLIPEFSGDLKGGTKVKEWIDKIDSVAQLLDWTQDERCIVGRLRAKGQALTFINTTDLRKTVSWKTFRSMIIERFQIEEPTAYKVQRYLNCKQLPGEPVLEYATRIRALAYRTIKLDGTTLEKQIRTKVLEESLLDQFLLGLDNKIKRYVLIGQPKSFQEAVNLACKETLNELMVKEKSYAVNALGEIDSDPVAPMAVVQQQSGFNRDFNKTDRPKYYNKSEKDNYSRPVNTGIRNENGNKNNDRNSREDKKYTSQNKNNGFQQGSGGSGGYGNSQWNKNPQNYNQYRQDDNRGNPSHGGHVHRDSGNPVNSGNMASSGNIKNFQCFGCGGMGHYARNCEVTRERQNNDFNKNQYNSGSRNNGGRVENQRGNNNRSSNYPN